MKISATLLAITLPFAALSVTAQEQKSTPAAVPLEKAATKMDKPEMIDAEIKKIDRDAKKITLKHGAIKTLDMPAMTMVFRVKEPALLDKLNAGDKVKFSVEETKNGMMVTAITLAK